jgi:carbonic anhydrase
VTTKRFCTAINCMDGRVQTPVTTFLRQRFQVDYVDMITEPGPNRILGRQTDASLVASILHWVSISVEHHHSVGIAVVGHYDCAGNPADEAAQAADTRAAVRYIREQCPSARNLPVIGLWVDKGWRASEVPTDDVGVS